MKKAKCFIKPIEDRAGKHAVPFTNNIIIQKKREKTEK